MRHCRHICSTHTQHAPVCRALSHHALCSSFCSHHQRATSKRDGGEQRNREAGGDGALEAPERTGRAGIQKNGAPETAGIAPSAALPCTLHTPPTRPASSLFILCTLMTFISKNTSTSKWYIAWFFPAHVYTFFLATNLVTKRTLARARERCWKRRCIRLTCSLKPSRYHSRLVRSVSSICVCTNCSKRTRSRCSLDFIRYRCCRF